MTRPDEELSEEEVHWNRRQKKSMLPAIIGLVLLCLILAYLLSHTAS